MCKIIPLRGRGASKRRGGATLEKMSYKNKELPYNKSLRQRASELRKAGNLSEALLWLQLKSGKFNGLDFDRQKIIGNYIVDFYCAEKGVAIEIDGISHDDKGEYDKRREEFLNSLGVRVLRIDDIDVKRNLDGVMSWLKQNVGDRE